MARVMPEEAAAVPGVRVGRVRWVIGTPIAMSVCPEYCRSTALKAASRVMETVTRS